MTNIYFIKKGTPIEDPDLKEKIGVVGYSQMELAAIHIPVTPGCVMEISRISELTRQAVRKALDQGIQQLEKETGRRFGDTESPLLLRMSLSPGVILETVPSIEHIGLNEPIANSCAASFDAETVYAPFNRFIEAFAILFMDIPAEDFDAAKQSIGDSDPKALNSHYLSNIVSNFPQNPYAQLETALLGMAKIYNADQLNQDIPASIVIQYMPHGDSTGEVIKGEFVTRNKKTGEPQLEGSFSRCPFIDSTEETQEISELNPDLLGELDEAAATLEGYFLDIRQVEFMVEKGTPYIIHEKEVDRKSMVTKLKILSDLKAGDQISDEEYVTSISTNELNSLLYSTINQESIRGLTELRGGVPGSMGATSGRVCFSTGKLMDLYWKAKAEEGDTNLILLMKSTFAEDVQAVEIGCGVITSEGGYTSHAPIVARSLGKPAIVYPDIEYHQGYVVIGGQKVNEGDYISMEIVAAEEPAIYLGKAELEYPDIEKNGVKDLLERAKHFAMGIKILANADTPGETRQAKILGADGIGLCRTEHMFLSDNRIYDFRDLLITKNRDRKSTILSKIKSYLVKDFTELFEIMEGMPITVRLLDAPLHEFLPSSEEALDETLRQLPELASEASREEIRQSFLRLVEKNPMLGHRGCRVGISSPEIYDIQTAAILEAAYKVKKEKGIDVKPHIMIPLIMSKEEMYLVKNGQIMEGKEAVKGIIGVIREFMKENSLDRQPFEVKIGAMIELPAAALSADEIAKQAEFFSFGTNDLTQTTMGLSRDDINSFLPAYTEMDIWKNDPFQNLLEPVKMLIDKAIQSGRQVRPDLSVGICGEHGANPEVIKYCLEIGMNYISCSPFGIPVATLAVARTNLARQKG